MQAVTADYSSSVVANWDAHKPDNYHKLIDKHGQGIPFIMAIMDMGMKREITSNPYFHHETTPPTSKIKVLANVAAPAAGANLVFVLHADSLDANNRYYPQKGDQIRMNTNNSTGIITNIVVSGGGSTVTITVTPNLATVSLGAVVAAEELAIVSNSSAEQSGQPAGRMNPTQRFDNTPQIIKTTLTGSGTEFTNAVWYTSTDKGRKINGAWSVATMSGEIRHLMAMSGALLFSQETTSTIADPSGVTSNNLYTTHGIFPTFTDRAVPLSSTAGTFAVADLTTISTGMDRRFAFDRSIVSYLGYARYNPMEDALTAQFADANSAAVSKAINQQLGIASLEGTLNFKGLAARGKKWGFRLLDEFRNPDVANFAASKVPDYAFYMGTGKVTDPETKAAYNKICACYKSMNGYSRKMEMWTDGAGGPGVKIGDIDARHLYWRSEIGAEVFAGDQIVFQTAP